MSFVYWVPNASGDWSTLSNWSGGVLPTSGDLVTISTSTIQTITHSTGNDFIARLTVGNDIFSMTGGALTIAQQVALSSSFGMSGGSLTIGGTLGVSGNLSLSGGALSVTGAVTAGAGFSQTGGSLTTAGSVSITGTAQLQGGYLGNSATLTATGLITMANYAVGGSAQIIDSTTIDQTGNVSLGNSTGVGAAIVVQAGATYAIANPVSISSGAATANLSNAGTLATLAGTGTSAIGVSVTSTGTVSVGTGSTLIFQGPLTTLSGTVTGTGTLGVGGGAATIAAGTTLTTAGLSVSGRGTSLTLGGSTTLSGGFSMSDGSTLELAGYTLTVNGTTQFNQNNGSPDITGSGTLITAGASIFGNNTPAIIGGSVAWTNSGTATISGTVQLGDSNTAAASVTNTATGVFDIVANGVSIANGSTPVSRLTNAGLLEMTANGGTAYVGVSASSTGTVTVAQGDNLVFQGPTTSLSGTLNGAGQISFAGGSSTIVARTVVSVAAISLYNNGSTLTVGGGTTLGGTFSMGNASTLALAGNVVITGAFSQGSGSTVNLGGHALTLNGGGGFEYVGGSGTLITRGTISLGGGNTIGGSGIWQNFGTAIQTSQFQIGDNNSTAASVINETTGVYDIAANNLNIYNGSTPISGFTNAGLLEYTGSGGGLNFRVNLASTGTISSALGDNLEFDGTTNTISGKILGAGQVSFAAGGSTAIAAGTTISASTFALYNVNTTVSIGGAITIGNSFFDSDGTNLALGANTLTLAGANTIRVGNGTPTFSGTGTLATTGVTSLTSNNALVIGSGVTWSNSGTVLDSGSFQIGNSSNAAGALVNTATGVFDILGTNYGINNGSTPISTFTNAGTVEITTLGGGVGISTNFTSTNTVLSAAGDNLEFDGQNNTLSGTLTGAGQISFGNNASTIAAGTVINVGTLAIYRANGGINTTVNTLGTLAVGGALQISSITSLALGGNMTVAGSYLQRDGATVTLGANTLTLNGTALFFQSNGSPLVTGSGTLATVGTTTLNNGGTALTIGGTATWKNTGTVLDSGSLEIGNTAGSAAALINAAGGVFEILGGGISVYNGSTPASTFTNAGTLSMLATNSTSYVSTDLVSSGVISSAAGDNLEIDGPANSISGTLTGAGNISFAGGSNTTIAGNTTINVGQFEEYGSGNNTVVTLGGNVTIGGNFHESDGSTLALAGHTLTINGSALFLYYYGPPQISGSGTLLTKGVTTLSGNSTALTLGGSVVWSNTGTVLDSGNVQIGNTSTVAASLSNAAGGVFDIVAANVSIFNGSNPASTFTNAGLLEMTAVGGSSSVNVAVANSGTVAAQGGTLGLSAGVSGTGTLQVSAGGTLAFSGAVAATQTLKFLDAASSASITIVSGNPTSFGATITGFVAGDTIDLTNISNATGTFSGGKLTFTDNTSHATVAVLTFTGTPNFTFASDGHGGTLIGDPPLPRDAAALTQRAYFTNVGSATETVALARGPETLVGGFGYDHPDILDLRQLLAGTKAAQDLSNIGKYLTTQDSAAGTTLWFDPSGQGHAAKVALLAGIGTSTSDLLAQHALLLK